MKNLILLVLAVFTTSFALNAQTLDELKSMKADKEGMAADLQSQLDATAAEIADLQTQIDILSGWRTGFSGLVGFDLGKSNGWVANPNPDASSTGLNIGLNAFALNDKEKTLWHNRLTANKAWKKVNVTGADDDTSLFDNGTVDILNLSSLAGYKISPKLALSGLGELNTSIESFLSPGTLDIGVGVTWLPVQNMTVVIHPLNYHIAFSGLDGIDSQGAIGAKVRVDYFKDFLIAGKKFAWSTTLTSFLPYSDTKTLIPISETENREAGLFEYTWLNSINFEVWNGIGVGIGLGLRNSDFESVDTQSFYNLGLTYGF